MCLLLISQIFAYTTKFIFFSHFFICLRDISYSSTLHDLKLLLLRFANEKSFSDDTGGGGRQSNMNLIPYILHMALYVINT